MKAKITLIIAFIFSMMAMMAQTPIPGGDVYGNWTLAGSPYLIEGDITVPADCTLFIDPGVHVEFQGAYIFYIYGRILAEGTVTDSILFSAPGTTGYRGLHIHPEEETDSVLFTYCRFQDGNAWGQWPDNCGAAIGVMDFSKIRVDNCLFIDNQAWTGSQAAGGAIGLATCDGIFKNSTYIDNSSVYGAGIMIWNNSNPLLANNIFYDNFSTSEGGALMVWESSNPVIINNIFESNRANQLGGAISTYGACEPLIKHNLFIDNLSFSRGGAIELWDAGNTLIINNTFANNISNQRGGAISITESSCPLLINNIMWNNTAPEGSQIYNMDSFCVPDFFNNDLQHGLDSVGGFAPQGQWKDNIDADPLFVDVLAGNFYLDTLSPCIDAGTDTIFDPDGTISDLGAYYFDQTGIGIDDAFANESQLQLSNYPNPFADHCVIRFRVPGTGHRDVRLQIYDIRGRMVDVFVNKKLSGGEYQLNYNAGHLPDGIYIMRLQVGREALSRKIVKR